MTMTVAFYDYESGEITSITQGLAGSLIAHHRPYVVLPEFRRDWAETHVVVDDQLVERSAEDLAALRLERAIAALRNMRMALLRTEVDPIVTNPIRWGELSGEQQAALTAYRQALLDWPDTETDPLNPTPPTPPE